MNVITRIRFSRCNPYCIHLFLCIFICTSERPKSRDGEAIVYRLKDWPSGEEFMALMPSRYVTDDVLNYVFCLLCVFFPNNECRFAGEC